MVENLCWNETAGKLIKEYRRAAGLTQDEASEIIGCETRTLQRYESGEREPGGVILLKMIRCYGIELEALYEATREISYMFA